jgi:xylose isomerase
MQKYLLIAAIALASGPALATEQAAELTEDSVLGTTIEEVTAALTGMGYEIRKSEMEDGKIEVYIVKDKTMGEVYVSPETGEILELELE